MGFLDILRDTAASVGESVGNTVSLASELSAQRAREIVADYLDAPEPPPELFFTPGGVAVPGRPLNDPTGRFDRIQSRAQPGRINLADRNAPGAEVTTDAGVPGFFGFSAGGLGGNPALIFGGLAAAGALLFLILRK